MKGNFYNKRPISHRGMYLNIDMRMHHSRKCHIHFRKHTYTHSIQLYLFTITPSRTHYHWKQYAKETACKGNRQPGASLDYNSHNINHTKHIWLIFLVKQVQDHSMYWDQYLSQSHAHRCAELYLTSDRDRLHFEAMPWKPMVYNTVMNANRTGHSPCRERYAEKLVMLTTAHTSQCELPYEKHKFFQTTQKTNESLCMLDLCGNGMHHPSRVVFSELFLSSTLRSKIGKPETKQQTFGNFNMKTKPQRN